MGGVGGSKSEAGEKAKKIKLIGAKTAKLTSNNNDSSELPLYLSVMDRPSREEGSFAHLAKRFILPPVNHAVFDLLNITEGRLTFLDLWLS